MSPHLAHHKKFSKFSQRLATALVLLALFVTLYFFLPAWILSLGLATLCLTIICTEWRTVGIWWLTPIYPVLPFALLILLNQTASYHHLILFIFALSASFDTGAYLIGTLFGRHKITRRISPKKSWEGLLGGFAATYLTSFALTLFYPIQIPMLLLTLLAGLTAFFGDLFVSWLKRRVKIKDSGTLLPGHGGLLDRLDSALFVVVAIYLLRNYFALA